MNQTMIRFIQNLLENVNVPVHFIAPPYDNLTWLDSGLRASLPNASAGAMPLDKWFAHLMPQTIYYVADTFHCSYSVLGLPQSQSFMLCGPVLLEEISEKTFLDIARNMGIPKEAHHILKNYYSQLPSFQAVHLFQNIFTTLADNIWGKEKYNIQFIDFNAMDKWYETHRLYQNASDTAQVSLPMIEVRYALENQVLDAVSKGNEQKAQELAARLCSCFSPQELVCSLRDFMDYTLAFNTLLRKKVEEAGVHPMHIDQRSSQHVRKIEQITAKGQCYPIMLQMIHTYCHLVQTHRRTDYSLLTQKVLAYISADLAGDLGLKAMSERLSVNASYLSALFKKEMGVPLTDYVNRQRMEQAKKLLIITVLPVKTIAQECGISDVYYFNRLFKKVTGYTPKAYREKTNRAQESMETGIAWP